MLMMRKLFEKNRERERNKEANVTYFGENPIDCYKFNGYYETLNASITESNCNKIIDEEDYFLAEFRTYLYNSDYHTYDEEYDIDGVYLAFNLNIIDTVKYFGCDLSDELFDKTELLKTVKDIIKNHEYTYKKYDEFPMNIEITKYGYLKVILPKQKLDDNMLKCAYEIIEAIRDYYSKKNVHITRMFGSYILLKNDGDSLRAIKATDIPIKYCPLMIKLLKEVGGDIANELIHTLEVDDPLSQQNAMCNLINEVVIKGGYFDTNRPLNSCEANVLFGASETMASAFLMDIIDAAVIVSNNLGTIITTNAPSTQGAVKRMTGLFYTSPNKEIVEKAKNEGIISVFPYTAEIDQLRGVEKAIELGYKRIAVSVAADNNYLHEELKKLEDVHDVKIYKFGLCSTGIDEYTAEIMKEYADVVWSCASKNVIKYIEPNAIAQVGLKIPVHIMTSEGWKIVSNHLHVMDEDLNTSDIELTNGEEKPIIVNGDKGFQVLKKKQINSCIDCPHPCI